MAAKSPDWIRLQRKIFGRYVRMKLASHHRLGDAANAPDDAIEMFKEKNSVNLISLMEVLSELECKEKYNRNPKMRIQQIDTASKALKFVYNTCKVQMKNKCAPEELVDGEERAVLGMLWGIMLKYLKFDGPDSEDGDASSLNAKDSLMMWLQNQTKAYNNVEVKNFQSSLRDGVALTALIHKFRPALIGEWSDLDLSDKKANVERVFAAANRYFGLEQYLTYEEYCKLDEPSMVVYVSEYYYGIAEQRKKDLAARRISKVIKLTIELDAMKAEFNESATLCTSKIRDTQALLGDRTIDDTLAGARARIAAFYEYKTGDKGIILSEQLKLEAVFSLLSMKLAHNKRAPYQPPEGCRLEDIRTAIAELEVSEQERNVALHKELRRQLYLVKVDNQHKSRHEKLMAWVAEKEAFLASEPQVASVSDARKELALLNAYDKENASVKGAAVAALKALGDELESERYEHKEAVRAREQEVDAKWESLGASSAAKRPVLDDHLAREVFKAGVLVMVQNHVNAHVRLQAWCAERSSYLQERESINSVSEAQLQLSFLDASDAAVQAHQDTSAAALVKLGADIRAKKYETQYSQYVYDDTAALDGREQAIAARFEELCAQGKEKRAYLDDQLAREEKKEELRLQYADLAGALVRWARSTAQEAAATTFGDSLEEVEAFADRLKELDVQVAEAGNTQRAAIDALRATMDEYEITENPYSALTASDLDAARADADAALAARQEAYQAELAEQRENDRLCKAFADVAAPFSAFINASKDAITGSQASLEDQLAAVEERLAAIPTEAEKLGPINEAADAVEAKNLVDNRHTTLTRKDVLVQWEQYQELLARKKKQLESEIELDKLHGVTEEQLQEVKDNFKTFDADGSGTLNHREIKALLYSLNMETTRAEVDRIFEEFAGGKDCLDEPSFTEYMISILGSADTPEEVIDSFVILNNGAETADLEEMGTIMQEPDIQYLKDTMNEERDYKQWTEFIYSK